MEYSKALSMTGFLPQLMKTALVTIGSLSIRLWHHGIRLAERQALWK
jgi:hypothetical protein